MDWWLAVLVMYLDTISAWFVVSGIVFFLLPGVYWIIFNVRQQNILWRLDGKEKVDKRKELMAVPIKKTQTLIPIAFCLWLMASLIPSPQTLFKIVALKYGADAVTSSEAKNLGNKAYEAMDKSLSILNNKLDEWNKKK